jgi:hypothetical protein
VHPQHRRQGIGRQLLDAALARLASMGRKRVLISPYTPNYFIPGVDVDAYPEAMAFLQATGWQTTSRPISMRAELTGFRIPDDILELEERRANKDRIIVRPVLPCDLPELMPFTCTLAGTGSASPKSIGAVWARLMESASWSTEGALWAIASKSASALGRSG